MSQTPTSTSRAQTQAPLPPAVLPRPGMMLTEIVPADCPSALPTTSTSNDKVVVAVPVLVDAPSIPAARLKLKVGAVVLLPEPR